MATKTFDNAKKNKADEFYTQMTDIENELWYYKDQFKDKVVFCNCDDPYESNFFKYFARNFNFLGLKKLIATCYTGSPIANMELSLFDDEPPENKTTRAPHKIEIVEVQDYNADGRIDLADVEYLLRNHKNTLVRLEGDGDFRSPECIELLKEADFVVANPPFSLFREYVAQLMEHEKKFIIIGNKNALTYKEIVGYFQCNKIKTGHHNIKDDGMMCWFTNLPLAKYHKQYCCCYRHYTPEEYPRYDNCDAIHVNAVADIPCDYDGIMGVPVSFLDKYNPEEFEIVKFKKGDDGKDLALNGQIPHFRLLIRRRSDYKVNHQE